MHRSPPSPFGKRSRYRETAVMASGQANTWAVREEPKAAIDLYWLPLGAGGHSVRLNGKVFEAVAT